LTIQSISRLVRDLRLRRGRERRGLTLAEGIRLVEEALATRLPLRHAVISPALETTVRGRRLKAALVATGTPVELLEALEFDRLAATDHPQGVLAVVEPPRWQVGALRLSAREPVLVLDAVQDPGNVGTMVRTAHALGAGGVVALPGTAELTNPKTLRASMGGYFRLPCVPMAEPEFLAWAASAGARVVVARAGGEHPRAWRGTPLALVVGNEGAGVRPSLEAGAAGSVGIPIREGAESLNVGVAAGILLYETTRENP